MGEEHLRDWASNDWSPKVGDEVTMDVTLSRRWWQFWLPKAWVETRTFTIGEVIVAEPRWQGNVTDGQSVWEAWGPDGLRLSAKVQSPD